MTLIFSIASILVSIAAFSVAYSQMKISSAKVRLDLYNKRFAIYCSAVDYYISNCHDSHIKIKEQEFKFIESLRESRFLFEPHDKIHEILVEIHRNGCSIHCSKEYKYNKENNMIGDEETVQAFRKIEIKNRDAFGENLIKLENNIEKYIQFKTISGWKFF